MVVGQLDCEPLRRGILARVRTRRFTFTRAFALALILTLTFSLTGVYAAGPAVKIGALLPLTGGLAPFGPSLQHSAELAVTQINSQGGIWDGQQLQLVIRDTQTSPQPGIDAATKLVTLDRVPAVIGPFASGVVAPVATSVTIPNKVLLITPSATAPSITDLADNDLVFRTTTSDALQGRVMGQVAYEVGYRRVAVIYVNSDYGQGQAKYFADEFKRRGGTVTQMVPVEEGKASYRGELQRATSSGRPQALLIIAFPDTGGITILRQAVEEGYFDEFLFTDGMQTPKLADAVGKDILEGAWGTGPLPDPTTPALDNFRDAYDKKYGEPPLQPFMTTTYDATFLAALALERAKKANGESIRDSLRAVANAPGEPIYPGEWAKAKKLIEAGKDIDYMGASGPIEFDEKGDIVAATVGVWRFKNGEIVWERTVEVRK